MTDWRRKLTCGEKLLITVDPETSPGTFPEERGSERKNFEFMNFLILPIICYSSPSAIGGDKWWTHVFNLKNGCS